jgi:protein-S-isoprenylcysteine O-methyltransferase Ste14
MPRQDFGRRPGRIARFSLIPVLDVVERAIVLVLIVSFAARFAPRYLAFLTEIPEDLATALLLAAGGGLLIASEAIVAAAVLVRRPATTLSYSPLDWILSFAGVSASLLARPATPINGYGIALAHFIMLSGLVLQIWAKLALWRSFGVVPANRGVRSGGPYRFVRHPMYAGYSLSHAGFLAGYFSVHNSILYASVLLIDIARLLREERLLGEDPEYARYTGNVRYRLIPYLF